MRGAHNAAGAGRRSAFKLCAADRIQELLRIKKTCETATIAVVPKCRAGASFPPTASCPSSFGVPNFAVMAFKVSIDFVTLGSAVCPTLGTSTVDAKRHPAAKTPTKKSFRFIVTSLCETRSGSAQSPGRSKNTIRGMLARRRHNRCRIALLGIRHFPGSSKSRIHPLSSSDRCDKVSGCNAAPRVSGTIGHKQTFRDAYRE